MPAWRCSSFNTPSCVIRKGIDQDDCKAGGMLLEHPPTTGTIWQLHMRDIDGELAMKMMAEGASRRSLRGVARHGRSLLSWRGLFIGWSILGIASAGSDAFGQAREMVPLHWYRCNLHTHTAARPGSDANASPEVVARWYKEHGYQCLVITDHDNLTDVAPLNALLAEPGRFIVLPGEEVTQPYPGKGLPEDRSALRPAHVNGIGVRALVPMATLDALPPHPRAGDTYRVTVPRIVAAGGIPQVNHPNLQLDIGLEDLLKVQQPFLMEIWNAFLTANNLGGRDEAGRSVPSVEELWDDALSHGKLVWGTAGDDAHIYDRFDDPSQPTPGKAWVVIQATELSETAILDALRMGRFYASTGIELEAYAVEGKTVRIDLLPTRDWIGRPSPTTRFLTRFVGAGGKVLAEVPGSHPRYHIRGNEEYVRAFITDSDGRRAWTQPVFLDARREKGL